MQKIPDFLIKAVSENKSGHLKISISGLFRPDRNLEICRLPNPGRGIILD
jgi:hypothetical protein